MSPIAQDRMRPPAFVPAFVNTILDAPAPPGVAHPDIPANPGRLCCAIEAARAAR